MHSVGSGPGIIEFPGWVGGWNEISVAKNMNEVDQVVPQTDPVGAASLAS